MTIRVFVLDDHELVREGLIELLALESDIEVVGQAGTAAQARMHIPAAHPDVAILDARLPDGSGIDVCRTVRSIDPSINALILTSYDDDAALFAAILAGASGYVLKDVSNAALIGAIRRVAAGESLIDPALTARVLERVRHGTQNHAQLGELTDQERKVLVLVAEGLTNKQIGVRMLLAEKAVQVVVSSLLTKLEVTSRAQAAMLASRLLR